MEKEGMIGNWLICHSIDYWEYWITLNVTQKKDICVKKKTDLLKIYSMLENSTFILHMLNWDVNHQILKSDR